MSSSYRTVGAFPAPWPRTSSRPPPPPVSPPWPPCKATLVSAGGRWPLCCPSAPTSRGWKVGAGAMLRLTWGTTTPATSCSAESPAGAEAGLPRGGGGGAPGPLQRGRWEAGSCGAVLGARGRWAGPLGVLCALRLPASCARLLPPPPAAPPEFAAEPGFPAPPAASSARTECSRGVSVWHAMATAGLLEARGHPDHVIQGAQILPAAH
nr:uncharacterized protein LOC119623029 [Chlorocebus sabaeus]